MIIPSADSVLQIFSQINTIPRPSHHEERIADFLCEFATQHHLSFSRDEQNCVVIRKEASPGFEQKEPLVLLNHMDMVCVSKEGKNFNPLTDPIHAIYKDDWISADGTSLGADNGIGLSMALAVLADDSILHPVLEVLTTTNEEDGMSGASHLSPDFIKGRKVINLDSEDYDSITIGAAGALIQENYLPVKTIKIPDNFTPFHISISGGLGGHSGVDITKGRANTIVLLAQILKKIGEKNAIYLAGFDGGSANASIASAAKATFAVNTHFKDELSKTIDSEWKKIKDKYAETDAGLTMEMSSAETQKVCDQTTSFCIIKTLCDIPYGPLSVCPNAPQTAYTSNNIGIAHLSDKDFCIGTHSRSFDRRDMEQVATSIRETIEQNGGHSKCIMKAPAWQEDADSPFINLVCDTFDRVLHFRPRKVSMHFVLEAGYFVQTYPNIQIASIGPRILEPHSTSERVQLSTIQNIWQVLIELLRTI